MKRLLLAAIAGVALAPNLSQGAAATPLYINSSYLSRGLGDPAPMIDAESFLNYGTFQINSGFGGGINLGGGVLLFGSMLYPFQTFNTLNYTNYGTMSSSPGFRFEYEDLSRAELGRFPAANVVNGAMANDQNANIYGENVLFITATNVVNRGVIGAGAQGILKIEGQNVDLSHSSVLIGAQNGYGGVQDYPDVFGAAPGVAVQYDVFGTNKLNNNFYNDAVPMVQTPTFPMGANGFNTSIFAMNNLQTYWETTQEGGADENDPVINTYHILFLANASQNISNYVSFGQNGMIKQVRWEKVGTNLLTGLAYTNDIFLSSRFSTFIDENDKEQIDQNIRITWAAPYGRGLTDLTPTPLDPATFDRMPGEQAPDVIYAAYAGNITVAPFPLDTTIWGRTYTNMAGRIEITGKEVNLKDMFMGGAGFVNIKAEDNIIANANTRISAPYYRLDLASKTGNLEVRNVLRGAPEAFVGSIEAWSGFWTNKLDDKTFNIFYVTVVNANLAENGMVPEVEKAVIKSANLTIADQMDVISTFTADSERLTITPEGAVNLNLQDAAAQQPFPNLRYVTNYGMFTATSALYLAGVQTQPWFTGTMDRPYEAIVNAGVIGAQGLWSWARYFESTGSILSTYGPLSIRADDGRISGFLNAFQSDISLTGTKFVLNGATLAAGRSINLDVSGWLSDGSLEGTVDATTATSTWTVGNGMHLVRMPEHASLLATEVTATAPANAEIFIRWAGADRGCSAGGFSDNAALGSLTLSGENLSVFKFIPATGNNALYVDVLILDKAQSGMDADGNPLGIELAPGFKLYFAKAMINGEDVSAQLSGKLNGGLCNVSDFKGWFSSGTAVVAPVINTDGGNTGGGTNNPPTVTTLKLQKPQDTVPYAGSPTTIGKYYGLFYETAGVKAASSGAIKLAVNSKGIYSGQVVIAAKTYLISGKLNAENTGVNVITRPGASALTLSFTVDQNGAKVNGTLTDGTWTSTVLADRQPIGTLKNKSAYSGKYTFMIPATETQAAGYGTALVTVAGNVVWSARFGDGTTAKQTAGVSREGVLAFYSGLSQGRGMAISWLQFAEDTLSGTAIAIVPDVSTNEVTITGSRYVQPKTGKRALELFSSNDGGHGRLVFDGAGIDLSLTVVVNNANKGRFTDGSHATLQLVPGTGGFQGLVADPQTGRPIAFRGVLLQGQNTGVGQYVINGQIGNVYLTPPQ